MDHPFIVRTGAGRAPRASPFRPANSWRGMQLWVRADMGKATERAVTSPSPGLSASCPIANHPGKFRTRPDARPRC